MARIESDGHRYNSRLKFLKWIARECKETRLDLWREVDARDAVPEVVVQQTGHSPVRFRVTVQLGEAKGPREG